MVVPNCEYGANGTFIFADSGLNEEPDAEKLSEIAISSSKSFEQLVGEEPKLQRYHILHMEVHIQHQHKKLLKQQN